MSRVTPRPVIVLVDAAGIRRSALLVAAVLQCLERVSVTFSAAVFASHGLAWVLPVAVGVGAVFVLRAATQSMLRLRVRGQLLQALASALLDERVVVHEGDSDAEMSLAAGLQSAEDIVASRVPGLLGDVPACLLLASLLLYLEPREMVLAGAVAIAAGAVVVVFVRQATARAAQRVWDAMSPALDDLSTAIRAGLELVGNGDEAPFLHGLRHAIRQWEVRSRGAARTSFLAGRAPVVAAAIIVGLFLLHRGGWSDTELTSAAVIASATPAFAGVARGTLDLARDLVQAAPIVSQLGGVGTVRVQGIAVPERSGTRITWDAVSFSYPGQSRAALEGLTLAWEPAELLGLAGRNGSGKSTFIRLLLALYPPTSGTMAVGGTSFVDIDRLSFRRGLGFLAQRPFLPDHMSVGSAIRLLAPGATREAIESSLTRLAVWSTLEQRSPDAPLEVRLGALSAGEKQRVAIARVLLRHADMLILDEPDANLDTAGIELLATILREESRTRRVIFVAHHPDLLAVADRVIRFEDGRVVAM